MHAKVTKITRKGQLTIPVEIRRALDISPGDQIVVEQQDDIVVLRPTDSVVRRTAGSLRRYSLDSAPDPADERAAFESGVAAEQAESFPHLES